MGWGEGTPQEGAPRTSGDGFTPRRIFDRLSAAGMTDGGRGGIFSWGFGFCLVWWGGGWRWKTLAGLGSLHLDNAGIGGVPGALGRGSAAA